MGRTGRLIMATRVEATGTEQSAATGATDSGQAPQSLSSKRDRCLARERYPRLYYQITHEHVSFDHIAKAWGISHDPDKPAKDDDKGVSQFLEAEARKKFSEEHGDIEREYWIDEPFAGCALTGDGRVHSVMNFTDPELVLYEAAIHQLCRDAHRIFETPTGQGKEATVGQGKKAGRDLKEVGEMLYVVLARVIVAASVLEKKRATQRERDDALAAARAQWKTARASVEEMIQRQARFEYFEGVGLGALITIPVLAAAGWAAVHYGASQLSQPGAPGSLTAAIVGGAAGAVISVTQRMTTQTKTPLVIDFTAPKQQKIALGALRPIVGAVFGAVVYFAIIGGLLAVEARTGKDASIAVAFFAVAGFAAGFSERFAADVLQRASSGILPTTQGKQAVEKPDELSLLLSEQPRHAATPTVTQKRQASAPKKGTGPKKRSPRPSPRRLSTPRPATSSNPDVRRQHSPKRRTVESGAGP
jgi:hypothetical protein